MCQHNGRTRYNCTIIDLYDRAIIASVNDEHINTELVIAMLAEALNAEKNTKGLILHSGQGVQFTLCDFVNFCRKHGITQNMDKAGCL